MNNIKRNKLVNALGVNINVVITSLTDTQKGLFVLSVPH